MKQWWSKFTTNFNSLFHKVGFWFLVILLSGMFLGAWGMKEYKKLQMDDSILIGGMVIDGDIYNIKLRTE